QVRRWQVAGAAAFIGTSRLLGSGLPGAPSVWRGLVWWAGVGRMLEWHLGMAEGSDGVPRDRLSGAGAGALSRLWLVPVLREVRDSPPRLCALILLGGITDWLDGALAGAEGTRLGRDLDTVADLAFFGAATRAVHDAGRLPSFAATALGVRYLIGPLLEVAFAFRHARRRVITPRRWGAPLRASGLALAAAGACRTGGALSTLGCGALPTRSSGWGGFKRALDAYLGSSSVRLAIGILAVDRIEVSCIATGAGGIVTASLANRGFGAPAPPGGRPGACLRSGRIPGRRQ